MQKSIQRLKKDLIAKRRELKSINGRISKIQNEADSAGGVGVLPERLLLKLAELRGNRSAAEREIKSLEVELMGDWAPKSWGNAS